jgi:hypothetical protein
VKSSTIKEGIGERILRGLGARASKGFPRANKDICELTKSDLNLDHWIWRGTWHRSMHFGGRTLRTKLRREYPKRWEI